MGGNITGPPTTSPNLRSDVLAHLGGGIGPPVPSYALQRGAAGLKLARLPPGGTRPVAWGAHGVKLT